MRKALRNLGILLSAFAIGMIWGKVEQSPLARKMLADPLPASLGQSDILDERE